jgi:hypothetical protein
MKPILRLVAITAALGVPFAHAAPVDVCAMLQVSEAEALVGKISKVTTIKPQGSLLGECTFEGAKGTFSAAARPAGEFDETLKAAADRIKPPEPVPGFAGKAVKSKFGLLFQPSGKPYFLQVIARKGDAEDMAMAIEGAKKLKQ